MQEFIEPNGLTREVPYDPNVLAFRHNGVEVRNPLLTPEGVPGADPVKDYGFELRHTGGGCMALVKRLECGDELFLTDADGVGIPDPASPYEGLIGRFDALGGQLAVADLAEASEVDSEFIVNLEPGV